MKFYVGAHQVLLYAEKDGVLVYRQLKGPEPNLYKNWQESIFKNLPSIYLYEEGDVVYVATKLAALLLDLKGELVPP